MDTSQAKKNLIQALKDNTGIISVACKKVGIDRKTYYLWREKDEKFAKDADEAIREGKTTRVELAESHHVLKLKEGEDKAVYFELERRHPDYKWKGELESIEPTEQIPELSKLDKKMAQIYADELKKSLRKVSPDKRSGLDKPGADKGRERNPH